MGSLQEGLRQFGTAVQIYLWSAQDSVDLHVLDRALDDKGNRQLLLRPNRPLQAGHEYELRASRGQENVFYYFEQPPASTAKRKGLTRYRWKVATAIDWQAPIWKGSPQVLKKVYENNYDYYNIVLFSCPVRDSSTYLIKITVRHQATGRQWCAYQTPANRIPWKSQVWVGESSCGGNVRFELESDYSVVFEAIDSAGNRASAGSAPLAFQAPKKVECCLKVRSQPSKLKKR
ncbi:hypothetical protein [Hymenobacter sp. B1770]|uniref:hypothetical protein n=1 Tax=Hymenobacter sp. B1770 TaxID=1718788 RepID=UPI003CED67FE